MEESLIRSSNSLNNSTLTILASIENKLTDPPTFEKAKNWHPKATLITYYTKDCYEYIDTLKREQKISEESSNQLLIKLRRYHSDILNIDQYIKAAFSNAYFGDKIGDKIINNTMTEKGFYNTFFSNTSSESVHAFLSKLQNNLKLFEYHTILFCNEQTASLIFRFETYSSIISQSSKLVEPGNEIEVTAGIGAFSKAALPLFTINGKEIPINDEGGAKYKFKASTKPGRYSIPVEINFVDEMGMKRTIVSKVEYAVAKICNE